MILITFVKIKIRDFKDIFSNITISVFVSKYKL